MLFRSEPETRTIIEEGLRGRSLYDRLKRGSPPGGGAHLDMAARWLARLHSLRLRVTPPDEFLRDEKRRLARYVTSFSKIGHPLAETAGAAASEVLAREGRIVADAPEALVQCHGDYHPKNILIGRDRADDETTRFASAIDFESSYVAPPALDVGCFLAQYENQCAALPGLLAQLPGRRFLDRYRRHAGGLPRDFSAQVRVFRARANLSIASYLIAVGKGDSADLKRTMRDAERALGRA